MPEALLFSETGELQDFTVARRPGRPTLYDLIRPGTLSGQHHGAEGSDAGIPPRASGVVRVPVGAIFIGAGVLVLAVAATYMIGAWRAEQRVRSEINAEILASPDRFDPDADRMPPASIPAQPVGDGQIGSIAANAAGTQPSNASPMGTNTPSIPERRDPGNSSGDRGRGDLGGGDESGDQPTIVMGGAGSSGTANGGENTANPRGPGRPDGTRTPPRAGPIESDPRLEGSYYLVIAETKPAGAVEIAEFARSNGLEAYVVPSHNAAFRMVIINHGFLNGLTSQPGFQELSDDVMALGRKWRAAGRYADFADHYLRRP